jgi:hypothetical protein
MRSEVVPQSGGGAWTFSRAGRREGALRTRGVVRRLPACAALALACSGTAHQVAIGPPPAKDTRAVLAGDLCRDNRCRCRELSAPGDGGAGVPDGADRKRFEVRLGSPYDLWVTINRSTVLYKSPERAEECFYVDLPSGEQQVELRASNPEGVSVALQVHELGTRTRSWYETFAFACGSPGACSFDELEANKAQYLAADRRLFDPCGTTKVKGISWDHGKAPDQLHPSELVVRFTLDIYRFAAWKQHGDDTCGRGGGRGPVEPVPPPPGTETPEAPGTPRTP